MNRKEYFDKIETGLQEVLSDAVFNGYVSQVFAWNIGARFDKNYDEDFIWRRALYLSSNACKLLRSNANNQIAIKALKQSAEVYEYLGKVSEVYDKEFCFILSALCYDISAYQANALCMMRDLMIKGNSNFYKVIGEEEIDTNLDDENYILYHIQLILLKKIPQAYYSNKKSDYEINKCEDWLGIKLFDTAVFGLYEHILQGKGNLFNNDINDCYLYYLRKGNVFISHLLQLLSCRFDRYAERSIWTKLSPSGYNQDNFWSRYIRILTNDIYDRNKIKTIENRRSIFEFWISQLRAIEQGVLLKDECFIIQMPTSAGKTFIAELAILDNLIKNSEKKCIYIAPFKALTNEKEIDLSHNLSKLGYIVSSLSGDYEVDEFQNFILSSTDVLIATPEKLDLLYRLQRNYFSKVSLLIVDEGHIIGDINERAALLEFLIIRLKIKIPAVKILFISAVMPPLNGIEFSKWLTQSEDNIIESPKYANEDNWEPTRKLIGKFSWYSNNQAGQITYPFDKFVNSNGELKEPFAPNFIRSKEYGNSFPNNSKGQTAVALAYKLSQSGSTLIFTSKPNWAESTGKTFLELFDALLKEDEIIHSNFIENTQSNAFYACSKWLGYEHTITKCVKRGIGIHYGDLPDAVRKSVETDYRLGILKVLICTNTIGQGVNFPIKNLIVHSLDIDARKGKNKKVRVRDFWNIIGRAGRAGKETEGLIIFVTTRNVENLEEEERKMKQLNIKLGQTINEKERSKLKKLITYMEGAIKDEKKFREYTDKSNIDKAESIFSLIVKKRLSNKISEQEMNDFFDYFSESFLMSLMVEELIETNDEELVEQVINNSLFKVQTIELTLLREGLSRVVRRIRDTVSSSSQLNVFASNGFSLKSNLTIEEYINEKIQGLMLIVENDDFVGLLEIILKLFNKTEVKEIHFSEKLEGLDAQSSYLFDFIKAWIAGKEINELHEVWIQSVPESLKERSKMFIFLSQGLNYKYPWAITSFLTILANKLGITMQQLPKGIKSLSSFVKYGLDNNLACFLLSIGIRSRELSKVIVQEKYSGESTYEALLSWLSTLTYEEISTWNFNKIETENIVDVSLKYNIKMNNTIHSSFNCSVKGTYYSDSARKKSLEVKVGETLSYERDSQNEYDPFAIKLMHENSFVGYIPRDIAKDLSIEIDLFNASFNIEVIELAPLEKQNNIVIKISKSLNTALDDNAT